MRGLVLTGALAATIAPMLLAPGAQGAKRAPNCRRGEVRRTIAYVHHKGGPVDHATGCAPKKVSVPTSLAAMQSRVRALALTFVPANVAAAFRGEGARRVATTDARTDGSLGADLKAHQPPLATTPLARISAAGTETKYLHQYTPLDTADDTGESFVSGSTTKATHLTGPRSASSSKELTVKHLINKCPDAAGVAHGTLEIKLRDLRIAGPRTITETSTFHAQVLAHFDDTAHIASVEIIGTWSFAVATRHTNRSVGGDVSASNFRQTDGRSHFDLKTSVTTGTDDDIVIGGGPIGVWVAEALAHEYLQNMLNSIPRGVCVNIVPDSPTVHVAPGDTVDIVAHLTDHHGQAFPGLITEFNGPGRVSPTQADANPDARFAYTAPAGAPAGGTDEVQLSHISKRGKGVGGHVVVIFDKPHFPKRFDGTWTRVITSSARPGWKETIHGTATYLRSPFFPESLEGQTSIPYEVLSASVEWEVTGTHFDGVECTITYSGSGTAPATENSALGHTEMSLEDVSGRPGAPSPEPEPFYYSIWANGDPLNPPMFDVSYSPGCHSADVQEPIVIFYLEIGESQPFGPETSLEKVQKSADVHSLAGQLTTPDLGGLATEDSWSFTGS
jgi:hypothetical protein